MERSQQVKEVPAWVVDEVTSIIVEQTDVDRKIVMREAVFYSDIPVDSLDMIELLMAFEDQFDLSIPEEDTERMRTVGDVLDYIAAHVDAGKTA